MSHSFIQNCFGSDNSASFDEKTCVKMEGKTNYRGAYRQLGTGIVECLEIIDVSSVI